MNHLGENLIDVQMSVLKTLERFIKNIVVLGMIHNPMVHNLMIHNSCIMHKLCLSLHVMSRLVQGKTAYITLKTLLVNLHEI